jgi:hypothetical protein
VYALATPVAEAIEALYRIRSMTPVGYDPSGEACAATGSLLCTDLLRADYHVALAAVVQIDGTTLQHFADTVRDNLDVVLAAVKTNLHRHLQPFQHASDALKGNRAMVMEVLRLYDGHSIHFMRAWPHVSEALRSDREVVMAAVQIDGDALRDASEAMQDDPDVVMAAIRQIACTEYKRPGTGSNVFMYASNELRMSKPFATEVVKRFPDAFEHCGYSLRHDLDFAMAAVGQHGKCLQMCSQTLRNTKAVVLAALSQYSDDTDYVFWHCSTKLQTDKDVVLAAIRHQNGFAGKGRWHLNERCDLERVVTTLYRRDLEVVAAAFYSRFYPRGLFAHSCREILDNAPHETREAVRVSYEAARWIASRVDSIVAQMLRRYNIIAY